MAVKKEDAVRHVELLEPLDEDVRIRNNDNIFLLEKEHAAMLKETGKDIISLRILLMYYFEILHGSGREHTVVS